MESVQDHLLKSTYIFKIAAGEFVGWPICYGYKILQSLDKGILYSGGRGFELPVPHGFGTSAEREQGFSKRKIKDEGSKP